MLPGTFDDWLSREWLLTNGTGGMACSTLIGLPTRREHGWLVWNQPGPRVRRWMLWSHAAETLTVDGRSYLLANFEFNNAVDPHGYRNLTAVELFLDGPSPRIVWRYALGPVRLTRQVSLPERESVVRVRYDAEGRSGSALKLQVWPMFACRALSDLRRRAAGEMLDMVCDAGAAEFRYRPETAVRFALIGRGLDPGAAPVEFNPRGDWWYNFKYRREADRGLEFGEDLMVPGTFCAEGRGRLSLEIVGLAGIRDLSEAQSVAARIGSGPAPTDRAHPPAFSLYAPEDGAATADVVPAPAETVLSAAARQFHFAHVQRDGTARGGLFAGFPWLDPFCRDACVALPGLLLSTGRLNEAREVLLRMALLRRDGALPTHLSDEPMDHEYVAADSALWFVHAVDEYLLATRDDGPTAAEFLAAVREILHALAADERDGMRVDSDGLLICQDVSVAATWMDARFAWKFCTPRIGKPVEINALWYHALSVGAERLPRADAAVEEFTRLAARVRESFPAVFWNQALGGLYDVITFGGPDPSLRPNQIFAVSLRHSPLSREQQAAVVRLVQERLLTPMGLRTLAADDPDYRGRYDGTPQERENAAHRGSVYAWLLGPFVEAYLRVHGDSPKVRAAAGRFLEPVLEHLTRSAAMGGISELFDGDPPHTPRGCFQQAWSVGEVLRAMRMTALDPAATRAPAPGGPPADQGGDGGSARTSTPPARDAAPPSPETPPPARRAASKTARK